MTSEDEIIRTADICDDHPEARVVEIAFKDYARRTDFHGTVVTFATHEDNKGIRAVLREGGEGKVLMVDGRGSLRRALCGGNIAAAAREAGWEGLIFNGCIRDQHEFAELDFGVKAVGTSPMPPRQDGVGRAGEVLIFGNVDIHPGDYVYADVDGVIVLDGPVHE